MPPHSTSSHSTHSPTTTTKPRIQIPLPPTSTSTTTTTHPPLPTALRSTINAHLLTTSAITTIQSVLLHHLQRAGWTDNVRLLVLDLLRSGECKTFGECMGVVIKEARGEGLATGMGDGAKDGRRGGAGAESRGGTGQGQGQGQGNGREAEGGVGGVNGVGNDAEKEKGGGRRRTVNVDVRIPGTVVDEGVQVVREALEEIVEVVDG